MNRFRLAALAAALAAGFPAFAPAASAQVVSDPKNEAALYEAAKREGTVVWYVGGPLEGMNAIAAEFQKDYPGIKIETLRLVGVLQYQRFIDETHAKKFLADVLQNTDYPSVASLIEDGHISQWRLPTIDRIPEHFRIKDFAYSQYTSTNAIIYNVNKVSADEVKVLETGWEAALDPRFKGRFSVSTMKCGTCYGPIHMFLDPKLKNRYGPEFLARLAAQQPANYAEVLVATDRVIAGEHDFTLWGWEAIAALKWKDGAPIRWLFPRPTPDYGNAWLALSRYAPHPNAARLFLNWLMSDRGATAMERVYGAKSTLQGIDDLRAYVKESWYRAPTELYPVDQQRWEENYHKDMDLWIATLKRAR